MLGGPELDTGLQVGSDKSGIKEENPLPRPAGHASPDARQGDRCSSLDARQGDRCSVKETQ